MKTFKLTIIAFALILSASVSAQNTNTERKTTRPTFSAEEMTAQQASRLVTDLGLDDATAAKFTEIYKRYNKELQDLRPKREAKKEDNKDAKKADKKPDFKAPSDADVDAQNKARFAQQRKTLDIQERYYNEFRGILSARQTNKVMGHGQQGRQGFGNNHNGFRPQQGRQFGGSRGNFGPQSGRQFSGPRGNFGPQQGRQGFSGPRGNFGPQQGLQFGGPRQFPGHRPDSTKADDKKDSKKDAKKYTKKSDSKK